MNHSLLTLLQPEAQTPPRIRHASSIQLVSSGLHIVSRNEARKRDEIWDVRQKTLQKTSTSSWNFTSFQRYTQKSRRGSRSGSTSQARTSRLSSGRSKSTSSTLSHKEVGQVN